MNRSVTAVMMLGAPGASEAEQLVHHARRLAGLQTIRSLAAIADVERVILALPAAEQAACRQADSSVAPPADLVWDLDPPGEPFHFGERLAGVVRRYDLDRVLYVGAGSMPLFGSDLLAELVAELGQAVGRVAITNNLHASDWLGLTAAATLASLPSRLPRDNMLGWVLQQEAAYHVRALPPSAATRLDVDTPTDLFALYGHPSSPPALQSYLANTLAADDLTRWRQAARKLATPATQVALIGRVASSVWAYVEAHTRCWLRVYSEERGMSASGRQAAGAVRSLLAEQIEQVGEQAFFDFLGTVVDAAYMDTRVYLAHHQTWPTAADRFASDLGRSAAIADERLRRLTDAALACSAPVVLGGHGVVAGDLYALIETLQAGVLT